LHVILLNKYVKFDATTMHITTTSYTFHDQPRNIAGISQSPISR